MSEPTSEDKPGFQVGNIGSVGGDVFSGTKIQGENIAHTKHGNASAETEGNPKFVKIVIAVAGLLAALAGLAAAISEFQTP